MLDLDPLWQSICCSHSGSGELHLALTANRMRGHFYPYMGHNPAPLLLVERHIWNIIKFIWELARQLLIWKNIIQVIPHFFLLGFSEMSDYKSESCNVTIAFFPLRLFQGQFQASTLFGTSLFQQTKNQPLARKSGSRVAYWSRTNKPVMTEAGLLWLNKANNIIHTVVWNAKYRRKEAAVVCWGYQSSTCPVQVLARETKQMGRATCT